MKPINSSGDSYLSSSEIKFFFERIHIWSAHRGKQKCDVITKKPFRLRSHTLKVIQNTAHGQSHLIMHQLHILKPKSSPHFPSYWLSHIKLVHGLQGVAREHLIILQRPDEDQTQHFQSSNTRGNIKLQRHPLRRPRSKSLRESCRSQMLHGHAASSFHHCQGLSAA